MTSANSVALLSASRCGTFNLKEKTTKWDVVLKKGPFVDGHLMKKVEAQANDEKEKSN